MRAATDDGDCAKCVVLPDDFVCGNCYTRGGKPLHGKDNSEAGAVDNLAVLAEGDALLWGDRSVPCTVVDTSFGSHVIVEGPNGTTYRIQPIPNGGFRLGDRGGSIDDFRRVDPDHDDP